ncbi:MAG TPA: type II TA system antitoxin MqsA family protein [Bdellovibrionota bacterium]|nr:type II TA system antitoxin MqsA family protein [Bdellovibrionota bacterium]
MKCLACGNTKFEDKKTRMEVRVKDTPLDVIVSAMVCTKCNESMMNDEQMNRLRKTAADEYRRRNKLLTSKQICDYRKALGMSQKEFAKYLSVGEASIKRWETFYVQDPVQNEHILLKCDQGSAEENALEVYWKNHDPDIYSGHHRFRFEIFEQVVLCLLPYAKSPLYLNKALFYADFLHFKNNEKSITGTRYATLEYGPCPDQYQNLFGAMLRDGSIEKDSGHDLRGKKKPNAELLDDSERRTIEAIVEILKKRGESVLFKLSHEEVGFKKTPAFSLISYEHAKSLRI